VIRSLVLFFAGCMGPLVDDVTTRSPDLMPPGSVVPQADAALEMQIRTHQFVGMLVPRYTAFAGGVSIELWDFGPVPTHAAPMYVLVDASGAPIDHPEIVGVVPGDNGYSPFWRVAKVTVTAMYRGEVIASTAALDDAVQLGLVEAPEKQDEAELEPIVTRDVRLDGAGAPDEVFYYDGQAVTYFEFGEVELAEDGVETTPRYVLRRDGGDPLNEVIRNVDIDGDGDAFDSNDILPTPAAGAYVAWHVTVPAMTSSIDTTRDQTKADHTNATQLFAPTPVAGVVLGYTVETEARVLVPTTALEDEP
jgi:hypothetical protein